jgi:hypothetical protein
MAVRLFFTVNIDDKMDVFLNKNNLLFEVKNEIFSFTSDGRSSSGPLPYRCDGFFFN